MSEPESSEKHARKNDPSGPLLACVEKSGSGSPVVFLHGMLGLGSHWAPTVERIARRATCVTMEAPFLSLRGRACNIENAEKMIEECLERTVEAPAVLVGNSLGGHLALRIALHRPDLVRGLVLAGSSGLFERTFEKDIMHRPSREWLARKIGELFYDPDRMPPDSIDRAYGELSERHVARAFVRLSRSAKGDHLGSRIVDLHAPTLLLWGRQDIVTPPRVAEQFLSLLPDARLRWIDRCGHAPMIEKPEEFADGVSAFLDELDAAERGGLGVRQEVA